MVKCSSSTRPHGGSVRNTFLDLCQLTLAVRETRGRGVMVVRNEIVSKCETKLNSYWQDIDSDWREAISVCGIDLNANEEEMLKRVKEAQSSFSNSSSKVNNEIGERALADSIARFFGEYTIPTEAPEFGVAWDFLGEVAEEDLNGG